MTKENVSDHIQSRHDLANTSHFCAYEAPGKHFEETSTVQCALMTVIDALYAQQYEQPSWRRGIRHHTTGRMGDGEPLRYVQERDDQRSPAAYSVIELCKCINIEATWKSIRCTLTWCLDGAA